MINSGNFIYQPNADISKETSNKTICYYAVLGDHDFIDNENKPRTQNESKHTLAKRINNKFYIRVGTYGRIYNPIGMFSEGKSDKFVAKVGKKEFDFKEVNQKIFDLYLNFLSTKNIAWLNNAEREMI